jgi:hypothetical protein
LGDRFGDNRHTMTRLAVAALISAALVAAPQTSRPDAEGFIRDWLVLAPIAIDEGMAASEIDRDLINGEAAVRPSAGATVSVLGWVWTWRAHTSSDFLIDFREAFGKDRGEDVAAYAVAYVIADTEMAVTLAVGSNDEFKAWLNGRPVLKFISARGLEKDSDKADVTLAKGQNVLVLKVINETNNWQACARFLKDGAAVTNLAVSLTPQ